MARYFRLEQAQGLVGELEGPLARLTSLKQEFDAAEGEWRSLTERVQSLGGVFVDRRQVVALRSRRESLAESLKESIDKVQQQGCLIKDLDVGLVDFPTLFRGEEVYLCWKLGEPSIGFWHRPSEGFRGRKPIDRDFMENHRGDEDAAAQ